MEALAAGYGERVDQALAAAIARDLLVAAFEVDPARFASAAFDPSDTWSGRADRRAPRRSVSGIALLPYASPDVALSARAALIAGDRFDVEACGRTSRASRAGRRRATRGDPEHRPGRPGRPRRPGHRRDPGRAGRPGPHDPGAALPRPRRGRPRRPRDGARRWSATCSGRYGERLGPWLRLRVGSSLDDTIEATALVALIGATVGDPAAEAAEAYVEDEPRRDDLFNLQKVGYIARVLERTPAEAARSPTPSAASSGRSTSKPATRSRSRSPPPSRPTFTARPAAGRVGVAVSWDAPVDPATLTPDPSLTLTRTVVPPGRSRSDRLVEVTLRATFGPQAVAGCYSVVDVLPSGLAPVGEEGQRVAFCLSPGKGGTDQSPPSPRGHARDVHLGTGDPPVDPGLREPRPDARRRSSRSGRREGEARRDRVPAGRGYTWPPHPRDSRFVGRQVRAHACHRGVDEPVSPVRRKASGPLLLADISGYTGFLQSVTDAHRDDAFAGGQVPDAYGLVSSLLDGIIARIAPPFTISKIEGDAVFAFARDDDDVPAWPGDPRASRRLLRGVPRAARRGRTGRTT